MMRPTRVRSNVRRGSDLTFIELYDSILEAPYIEEISNWVDLDGIYYASKVKRLAAQEPELVVTTDIIYYFRKYFQPCVPFNRQAENVYLVGRRS